jgi:hypothetical protein
VEAHLTGDGLHATRTCPEAGWQPQLLWQFLTGLADNWRGWEGERTWVSEDAEVRLTALHDKTNAVIVTVQFDDGSPARWILTAELELDPGVFQTLANDAKRLSSQLLS